MFSGFGSSSRSSPQGQTSQDDQSLDAVLSFPESKVEFVVVIMLCMDQMRKALVDPFDPSIMSKPIAVPASSINHQNSASSPWAPSEDSQTKPPSYGQATRELTQDDYFRRKREVSSREVQELQQSVLAYFSKWRVQVLKRVAEVLRVRPDIARAAKARRAPAEDSGDLIDLDDSAQQTKSNRQPVKTRLSELSEDKRVLLVNSLLLLLLSLEHYSSYSRVLLLHVSLSLNVTESVLNEKEDAVAHGLLVGAKEQMSAEDAKKRDNNRNAANKAWKVGLATVAGAAVIGLTGGLAAPVIAGAMGTVLGGIGLGGTAIAGLLGGLAGNFVIVGSLFGAYGGSMTGKMMEKYAKEVEDFEFIPLRRLKDDQHRLRLAIGISGWLSDPKEVYLPWLVLGDQIEGFVLQWEVGVLQKVGGSIYGVFKELAVKYVAMEIIKRTVFAGLLIAMWPLALLRIAKALTNSFSVASARADRAGEVLADALIHKAQGERPVTLIGYSLGSRVIFSCLQTLAKKRAFGLVESVFLIGSPITAESLEWRSARSVVADRVVNVYSESDYVLGLVFRASSITPEVAGLQAVQEVACVENYNVSDLVSGHLRYRYLVGQILQRVGYDALDLEQIAKEKDSLAKLDEYERQLKKEAEEKRRKTKAENQSSSQTCSVEWDDILEEGDQDITELNDKEIEKRLQELKLKEEKDREGKKREERAGSTVAEPMSMRTIPPSAIPDGQGASWDTSDSGRGVAHESDDDGGDSEDEGQRHRITMIDTED